MAKALKPRPQGDGDNDVGSDDDDRNDMDYIPVERESTSSQPIMSPNQGGDEELQLLTEEKMAHENRHPNDKAAVMTEADSEKELSVPDTVHMHHSLMAYQVSW